MYRLLIGASYIWNKKVSSESFHTLFEDFVIFLFLESFYPEKWKFYSLNLNKEKTEKIRDVTKSLYDICKVYIYKDSQVVLLPTSSLAKTRGCEGAA